VRRRQPSPKHEGEVTAEQIAARRWGIDPEMLRDRKKVHNSKKKFAEQFIKHGENLDRVFERAPKATSKKSRPTPSRPSAKCRPR
jgi:hypothetical protein